MWSSISRRRRRRLASLEEGDMKVEEENILGSAPPERRTTWKRLRNVFSCIFANAESPRRRDVVARPKCQRRRLASRPPSLPTKEEEKEEEMTVEEELEEDEPTHAQKEEPSTRTKKMFRKPKAPCRDGSSPSGGPTASRKPSFHKDHQQSGKEYGRDLGHVCFLVPPARDNVESATRKDVVPPSRRRRRRLASWEEGDMKVEEENILGSAPPERRTTWKRLRSVFSCIFAHAESPRRRDVVAPSRHRRRQLASMEEGDMKVEEENILGSAPPERRTTWKRLRSVFSCIFANAESPRRRDVMPPSRHRRRWLASWEEGDMKVEEENILGSAPPERRTTWKRLRSVFSCIFANAENPRRRDVMPPSRHRRRWLASWEEGDMKVEEENILGSAPPERRTTWKRLRNVFSCIFANAESPRRRDVVARLKCQRRRLASRPPSLPTKEEEKEEEMTVEEELEEGEPTHAQKEEPSTRTKKMFRKPKPCRDGSSPSGGPTASRKPSFHKDHQQSGKEYGRGLGHVCFLVPPARDNVESATRKDVVPPSRRRRRRLASWEEGDMKVEEENILGSAPPERRTTWKRLRSVFSCIFAHAESPRRRDVVAPSRHRRRHLASMEEGDMKVEEENILGSAPPERRTTWKRLRSVFSCIFANAESPRWRDVVPPSRHRRRWLASWEEGDMKGEEENILGSAPPERRTTWKRLRSVFSCIFAHAESPRRRDVVAPSRHRRRHLASMEEGDMKVEEENILGSAPPERRTTWKRLRSVFSCIFANAESPRWRDVVPPSRHRRRWLASWEEGDMKGEEENILGSAPPERRTTWKRLRNVFSCIFANAESPRRRDVVARLKCQRRRLASRPPSLPTKEEEKEEEMTVEEELEEGEPTHAQKEEPSTRTKKMFRKPKPCRDGSSPSGGPTASRKPSFHKDHQQSGKEYGRGLGHVCFLVPPARDNVESATRKDVVPPSRRRRRRLASWEEGDMKVEEENILGSAPPERRTTWKRLRSVFSCIFAHAESPRRRDVVAPSRHRRRHLASMEEGDMKVEEENILGSAPPERRTTWKRLRSVFSCIFANAESPRWRDVVPPSRHRRRWLASWEEGDMKGEEENILGSAPPERRTTWKRLRSVFSCIFAHAESPRRRDVVAPSRHRRRHLASMEEGDMKVEEENILGSAPPERRTTWKRLRSVFSCIFANAESPRWRDVVPPSRHRRRWLASWEEGDMKGEEENILGSAPPERRTTWKRLRNVFSCIFANAESPRRRDVVARPKCQRRRLASRPPSLPTKEEEKEEEMTVEEELEEDEPTRAQKEEPSTRTKKKIRQPQEEIR
ncbi:trichohyalin-like [Anolis sagrei]|uniref:trichohyalin-like n=1 Tax=Anolis sagrei TaxID=38937 RepID=UPI00351F82F2